MARGVMNTNRLNRALALFFFLSNLLALGAVSEGGSALQELPFESDIRRFEEADRVQPPFPGGILFVGSSIFREWADVAEMMLPLPVRNRAFGGSRTGDQVARFDRVVVPFAPRILVYYCGSNDLKSGDAPEAIFARFVAFSERARHVFPGVRLVFVSSTRSPDRVSKWERVDAYNGLARSYCASTPGHTFVDVNPVLVDEMGCPRLELYRADKLHLEPAAYVGFAGVLKPVLTRLWDELPGLPQR